ncbi:Multidrug resistance efflux pump [Hyella patelloides LEGE 07179]|uniref:Multidrug resistance efflux pump n=1 Tax=Hyella patelloides LEGE 07179 TaxID=945734 RepID=A0A563W5F4_9CYAN|nr:biotin/lipoyl-binding protein [Hyella patelloides]VEP18906.1 Multidrug resistance efflux pump [Hyella patelloides LEGE 07179]
MIDKPSETVQWTQDQEAKESESIPPVKKQQKRKYFPRQLPYILGGLGLLTMLILAFRPSPITVDVAEVKRGDVSVTVDEEGETRIRKRYNVSASVEGRLRRINLDEGDRVTQGDIIAQIDPLPLESDIQEAQARLRQWEAEKAGVETQRPKREAIAQAEARIRAAEAKQKEAVAKVERARADLEQARRDRQRNQQLHADGVISRQEKERAELDETIKIRALEAEQRVAESSVAEVKAAQEALSILRAEQQDPDYLLDVYDARIASIKAELAKLTDDANHTNIRSPIDGYVLRVNLESAKYVEAGTQLLELGNPQDLEIVVDLLSSDAVKVKPDAMMFLEQWGGQSTLKAKVRYVEPSAFTKVSALGVEEQRVNVIADFVDLEIPLDSAQSGFLQDRYRVETKTVVWSGEDVMLIPLSALFRCEPGNNRVLSNDWCTFVVENNQAQKRQIKVSQRSNFEAVIEKGLQEEEKVILHPTEQIRSGTKVKFSTQ